ncbi:MAG TPA: substrate-binding domain-containing protein [Burkholderiales bacterium]|nr:substrate-binding domain-containing protein [Burkholderiales bacterium]
MRLPDLGQRVIAAAVLSAAVHAWAVAGDTADPQYRYDPPWNAPPGDELNFTVPGIDNVPDLQGDVNDPQLTVFFAGNQYMVVRDLVQAFRAAHPEITRVFVETLPPEILTEQIERGTIVIGNMRIALKPDVYATGRGRMQELQKEKQWFAQTVDYARNRLAIMTAAGNPGHIAGWDDLARKDAALCMPNPRWEGIARNQIIPIMRKSGGDALVKAVYEEKVSDGSTFLTQIHHRQTPLRIMQGKCEAGAVWYTEAYFHATMKQHPVAMVTLPDAQNSFATYTAGLMKDAPHAQAGESFLQFLASTEGQAIYQRYGFLPPK